MNRLHFIFLTITICILNLSACNSDTSLPARIILDYPHGALRLHVQREGDSYLFYGASPFYRIIPDNTFDIDDLFQQLLSRVHDNVPLEDRPTGQPYGMVTIEFSDGGEQDYLIYDEMFALELFQTACANLMEEDKFSAEIINAECVEIGNTTP